MTTAAENGFRLPRGGLALGLVAAAATLIVPAVCATEIVVSPRMHHLRHGSTREWDEFAEQPEAAHLDLVFTLPESPRPWTLGWRQRDVKQAWQVLIDEQLVAALVRDENDQRARVELSAAAARPGQHRLRIAAGGSASDDILLGDIRLTDAPLEGGADSAQVSIETTDLANGGPLPCRLTVVDQNGSLVPLSAASGQTLAVRTGVIYTRDGRARFDLAAGVSYTIYASRGFEYSVASAEVSLEPAQRRALHLELTREVPTPGYVACDTHCHTFTYSRHGDCSIEERMLTLAGEGIELPISTDHNVAVDYEATARAAGVRSYFTPVVGNEVTTNVGHFNVFPLAVASPAIDFSGRNWDSVFHAIRQSRGVRVIVLNHARDLHAGFRPFDPARHISLAGEDVQGWRLEANAMEVLNSGALRSDPLELVRDWFGMLNAGSLMTPVGSSDSHDVSRSIVGQGRTYVRCPDGDVAQLDVAQASDSLAAGHVMVAFGLLAEITVDGKYGPGELVPAQASHEVQVRVLGPSWTQADRVALFANGSELHAAEIVGPTGRELPTGVKWAGSWTIDALAQDVQLVALAIGPGKTGPFWPIAKPYQPSSTRWQPYVLGLSGAVRIDGNGDGQFSSPREDAARLMTESGADLRRLLERLAPYDEAMAVQAASLLRRGGLDPASENLRPLLATAPPAVQRGFRAYARAWSESLRAAAVRKGP